MTLRRATFPRERRITRIVGKARQMSVQPDTPSASCSWPTSVRRSSRSSTDSWAEWTPAGCGRYHSRPKNRCTDSYLGVMQATPPEHRCDRHDASKAIGADAGAAQARPDLDDGLSAPPAGRGASSFHGWEPSMHMGAFCRNIVAPTLPAGFSAMTKERSAGPFIA